MATGFIESQTNCSVVGETAGKECLKPASWGTLKELAASKLITIGGHIHSQPDLPTFDDDEIAAELEQCDALLQERLGVRV